jgi:predicted nucleotidyltransferase
MPGDITAIADRIRERRQELAERYTVSEIGIFGSCVRGEDSDASDLDILVTTTAPLDLFDFLNSKSGSRNSAGSGLILFQKKR